MSRESRAQERFKKYKRNKFLANLIYYITILCILSRTIMGAADAETKTDIGINILWGMIGLAIAIKIKHAFIPNTKQEAMTATANGTQIQQKTKPPIITIKHKTRQRDVVTLARRSKTQNNTPDEIKTHDLPTPQELYDAMGQYVIGQEKARKDLAIAVYNHYKRNLSSNDENAIELAKSNVLLLGPTGSGKTLMVKTLAKTLQVPLIIADATTLTEAGYVGEDVESMLNRLVTEAGSIEEAQTGIIYIDEIDKIAKTQGGSVYARNGKDPSGEGVQQALLKLLEGSECNITPPSSGIQMFGQKQKANFLDTTKILFICGGAFVGLDQIIQNRLSTKSIGFIGNVQTNEETYTTDELLDNVTTGDLTNFGLIPELIGRIPHITHTCELDTNTLISILTEPKNALVKQYQQLFDMDGAELIFTQDALEAIAAIAQENRTGARGLRAIMEDVLSFASFDLPNHTDVEKVIITKDVVTKQCDPTYIRTYQQR